MFDEVISEIKQEMEKVKATIEEFEKEFLVLWEEGCSYEKI